MEYRMYGFVPYNLSEIQKGIQFGHAVVEYGRSAVRNDIFKEYTTWADYDKTFIILNGGTTNNNPDKLGTLNEIANNLAEKGIITATFNEPDLGDQLTAVVFLLDERYWNFEKYPDDEYSDDDDDDIDYEYYNDRFFGEYGIISTERVIEIDRILEVRDYIKGFRLA